MNVLKQIVETDITLNNKKVVVEYKENQIPNLHWIVERDRI